MMHRIRKNVLAVVLVIAMLFSLCGTALAAAAPEKAPVETTEPIDLGSYLMDNTQLTQNSWTGAMNRTLPSNPMGSNLNLINGYLSYTLESGRTIKLYIPEYAALRNYIYVIALPNGVEDTYAFLQEQGWIDIADTYGELLFVLEPADGEWGTVEDEADYLYDCLHANIANDNFGTRPIDAGGICQSGAIPTEDGYSVSVFSGHSCNYYVGYGEGCAVLESWTANNPMFVAGQAFLGGESAGEEVLSAAAAVEYNGINNGGYYPGFDDETFHATLKALYDEGLIASPEFITNADIAAPTLFAGYAEDDASIAYWKAVNDCAEEDVDGLFWQDIDSDAFQTRYTNSEFKAWGIEHGLSAVKVTEDADLSAAQLREFLGIYTRYTNPFAYSNTLGVRTDYYTTALKARAVADSGEIVENYSYLNAAGEEMPIDIYALEKTRLTVPEVGETGDMYICIYGFQDNDRDEMLDPTEIFFYIPDSAKEAGKPVPVLEMCPGAGQQSTTIFDVSQYWAIANDNGFALIIISGNSNCARSALAVLTDDVAQDAGIECDLTRVYGSGHSMGSGNINTMAHSTEDDLFAAVSSTSMPNGLSSWTGEEYVPTFLMVGQADISEAYPNAFVGDLIPEPWEVSEDPEINFAIHNWLTHLLAVDGIALDYTPNDKESFLETCSDYQETEYTHTYTFSDENDVVIARFGRTMAREHNCMPQEFRLAWDFVRHYNREGDGTRWYSESAFAENDAVQLIQGEPIDLNPAEEAPAAAPVPASPAETEVQDLNAINEALAVDWTQASQLPLTGRFTASVAEGRSVEVYIAEEASIRSYFTIIAVPDGVDTWKFLEDEGWLALADQKGEGLFVLEPGENGWGTAEEEAAYLGAAIGMLRSGNNANGVGVFSTFGEFYVVGYGQGASLLELWAAQNPLLVISQVFVDGATLTEDVLAEAGSKLYDGSNTGGYPAVPDFEGSLKTAGFTQISNADIAVPTWFAGGYAPEDASVAYWKAANDCVDSLADGAYWQAKGSDALQTLYANSQYDAPHGISQVKLTEDAGVKADEIYAFLSFYTRYDNTFAYSNAIALRLDYTAARVGAQRQAKAGQVLSTLTGVDYLGNEQTVEIFGQDCVEIPGHGIVEVGVFSFHDDDGDGKNDPREYLVYVPQGFDGQTLPVLYVYPGNTQTDGIFFDCTQWYQVADKEGIVLVFVNETYNNAVSITHKSHEFFQTAMDQVLIDDTDGKYYGVKLDFSRVYATGQSLGSMITQEFARSMPDFYAAVASTSGTMEMGFEDSFRSIPTFMMSGESDLAFLVPDITCESLSEWANYFLTYNGLGTTVGEKEYAYGADRATLIDHRHNVYSWENAQGIPVFQWGQTILRSHNCYPAEMPILWDYLKNFSKDPETGKRFYNGTEIDLPAVDFSNYDVIPELAKDFSQAAQLPLTGYFKKTVAEGRTVKVYVSEEASVRTYFTVVAVPDGVNTEAFLTEQGWFDLADQKGEALFVLEPGADGWGTAEEEAAYLDAATAFLKGGTNADRHAMFTTYGEFYLVGYGKGAAALELWAAKNPIFVISQVYMDGESAGSDALTAVASDLLNGRSSNGDITDVLEETLEKVGIAGQMANKDIPIPTKLVNYTGSEEYWQTANDCEETGTDAGVYYQSLESDAYATHFANSRLAEAGAEHGISAVEIAEEAGSAAELYAWMAAWTRYDTTFNYGNAISPRLDYTEARVAAQQQAKAGEAVEVLADGTEIWGQADVVLEGHGTVQVGVITFSDNSGDGKNDPREYLLFVPEGFEGKKLPVLMVWPGNSQTDSIFMDSTPWWQLAEEKGFVAMFICETYSANACSVSHADNDLFYHALMTILKDQVDGKYAELDFSRLYTTGQSAGSSVSQSFAITNPEFYAAAATTSAAPRPAGDPMFGSGPMDVANQSIPSMMISGQMDAGDMAQGFNAGSLTDWANYMLQASGIDAEFAPGTADYTYSTDSRHPEINVWTKEIDGVQVPMVEWGMCLLRPHNPYPSDMVALWDFLEHYSYEISEDGIITRYYSESAFEEDDSIVIAEDPLRVEPKDLDRISAPDANIDYTQSAQIPLDGWYKKTLSGSRVVKMYFPEYAACRAYFTVVAVPNGVDDPIAWAEEQGYTQLMDERGEVLALLQPALGAWGDLETELAYVTDAMNFVNSGRNAKNVMLFTNYSTFYLVGYGEGAPALEAWAADHPILVGSQAYVNGVSAGEDCLAEIGAKIYDGTNTGGYDPGIADLDLFEAVLGEHGYEPKAITRAQVALPTWLIGYEADDPSVAYWKSANDCLDEDEDGVFWQAKDSDAFQTEYANSCTEADHGISQVKLTEGDVTAQELAAFLYAYSRYNVPFAYSNHISERQDYTAVRVAAQAAAQSAEYLTEEQRVEYAQPITAADGTVYDAYYVLAREQGPVGQGTVESGILAFSDDNGDGVLDAREYLMYIPDCAKGAPAPIVFQFPGMTQSVSVGFDSTQWWRVANDHGVIIVIVGEAYNNGVALSFKNSDMEYYAIRDILEKDESIQIDWTRVYGSGHSLGSNQVQDFIHTHPEFFAAVGSTSFGSRTNDGAGVAVPAMLVTGQSDLPFLMKDLWTSDSLKSWFGYLAEADNLKVAEATADNADAKVEGEARTWTYTWNNEQDIPMVSWGQTYLREHNCLPHEVPMSWEFISHYCLAEDGSRYYSPSAFEEDDLVPFVGEIDAAADAAADLDEVTELAKDFSQAAQLPLTGYFTKTVAENRTVKVYISPEASVRTYFTIVAVPDGVDTKAFLEEQGWFALADEKGEALYVLEPGEDGWGTPEEEAEYLDAAIGFVRGGANANGVTVFTCFGEFYLAGYGKGAAALELWAAKNPVLVISQAFIDGESAGNIALATVASEPYGGRSANGDISDVLEETIEKVGIAGEIAPKDVPVPTLLIGFTGSEEYWQTANDCQEAGTDAGVYFQSLESDAYATDYANGRLADAGAEHGLSQVEIAEQSGNAAQIYAWLAAWTRYDNTFNYSNALAERLDYTAARVAAQQQAKAGEVLETLADGTEVWGVSDVVIDGHGTVQVGVIAFSDNNGDGKADPREYLLFLPEGHEGEKLPILMIYPGNSQTDSIFMDSTLWWQLAEDNGIALVFICETYSANACSVSHADSDIFYHALINILHEKIDGKYAELDFSRIYGSGQSAGSMATQGFAITNPEFFAAVGSTSAAPLPKGDPHYNATSPMRLVGEPARKSIPTMMVTGQMDVSDLARGFDSVDLAGWGRYMLRVNRILGDFTAENADIVESYDSRHPAVYSYCYTVDGVDVPVVRWAQCLLRPHNCYPSDMVMLWDFVSHFSFAVDEDGNVTRCYSPSAFVQDDAIVID